MDGSQNRQYRLFKYRSVCGQNEEYTRRIIAARQIYYAAPNQFNDPFDCDVCVCMDGADISAFGHANSSGRRAKLKEFSETWLRNEASKSNAVLSLSEINDSLLMWSHYSDCHRGVCLEFHFDATEPLHKITYSMERPLLYFADFDENKRDHDRFKRTVINTLTTKAVAWDYEKEWRCIDTSRCGERPMPRDMLTGIIFGCRTSDADKKMIRDWVASSRQAVDFYQARQRDGAFALDIYPIAR